MAGFLSGKMKRKDLEEVSDEFSEFSLSSPARKIRRLDADLPPIMEEEDPAVPTVFEQQQQLPRDLMSASSSVPESGSIAALNEERALVLYRTKPVDAHPLLSPGQSNVSLRVSSDLIHGLRNQAFRSGNQSRVGSKHAGSINDCLAVVPWVPNQCSMVATGSGEPEPESKVSQEPMEAEEIECVSMELEEEEEEEEEGEREDATTFEAAGGEGFHQRQQHCITPQPPPNPSTPIMWSR